MGFGVLESGLEGFARFVSRELPAAAGLGVQSPLCP